MYQQSDIHLTYTTNCPTSNPATRHVKSCFPVAGNADNATHNAYDLSLRAQDMEVGRHNQQEVIATEREAAMAIK